MKRRVPNALHGGTWDIDGPSLPGRGAGCARRVVLILLAVVAAMASPVRAQDAATDTAEAVQITPETAEPDQSADAATVDSAVVPKGSRLETILFFAVGGFVAVSAVGCVLSTNIVRMAVWLFGTLGSVAVLYFLMAASFLGAIQLIVYAGGTLIVIIFGVMLTSKSPWVRLTPRPAEVVAGGLVCLALFAGLAWSLVRADWGAAAPHAEGYTVAHIGRELLTTYLVPFELASVLLLAVMIGAAYLARTERLPKE